MSAVVWLVLGVALIGAELLTLDLILVMLGAAALAAGGVALLDGPVWLQLATFAGAGVLLLLGVRPAVKRHLEVSGLPQGADTLQGRQAVVVSTVDAHHGQVRIDGELWAARPFAGGPDIPAGQHVIIGHVSGVTLHVYPEEIL